MAKLKGVILKTSSMDKFRLKCSQIFLYLCVLFFAISIVFNVTYSIAPVSGMSMYPTINVEYRNGKQDRVVLNYIKNYKKGDVIVAKKTYEEDSEIYMYVIKRLIAVGGDRVKVVENGDIYVNDVLLVEDYVNNNKYVTYYNLQALKQHMPQYFDGDVLVIPKDYVFYLGDNRGGSTDCSCFGPVSKKEIVAKADYLIRADENFIVSVFKQIFGEKRL